MPETPDGDSRETWMVITLRSGLQLRSRVTEYTVQTQRMSGEIVGLKWTTHADSPTRLKEIQLPQIDAVHTEYVSSGGGDG